MSMKSNKNLTVQQSLDGIWFYQDDLKKVSFASLQVFTKNIQKKFSEYLFCEHLLSILFAIFSENGKNTRKFQMFVDISSVCEIRILKVLIINASS